MGRGYLIFFWNPGNVGNRCPNYSQNLEVLWSTKNFTTLKVLETSVLLCIWYPGNIGNQLPNICSCRRGRQSGAEQAQFMSWQIFECGLFWCGVPQTTSGVPVTARSLRMMWKRKWQCIKTKMRVMIVIRTRKIPLTMNRTRPTNSLSRVLLM